MFFAKSLLRSLLQHHFLHSRHSTKMQIYPLDNVLDGFECFVPSYKITRPILSTLDYYNLFYLVIKIPRSQNTLSS